MPFASPLSRLSRPMKAAMLAGSVLAGILGFVGAPAHAASFSDDEKLAIQKIVRQYLIEHPEVLVEAMQSLEAKQQVEKDEQSKVSITENRAKIYDNPNSPVSGNPKGDVTLVEFFDYQCGYCKAVMDDLDRAVKDDGKVRLVFKEFPILGPASVTASKAALAARNQGKYLELHNALMSFRGRLDDATIFRLAGTAGLDTDRLKKDMESSAVNNAIAENMALAEKLNIRGTPAFIIGDKLVPGAVRQQELASLISETRKK